MSTINLAWDGLKQKAGTSIDFVVVNRALRIYDSMHKVMEKAEKWSHQQNANDKTSVATWN